MSYSWSDRVDFIIRYMYGKKLKYLGQKKRTGK